ncbi:MAG TPA: phenylalanine--tRNA ligase beta subunit-related protein [Candidatus Acidoferrales bacterium]|nr:phenylalanine--tRNA ligase beta subunit-related protein [Candidatus Acidoferrales bacterium]
MLTIQVELPGVRLGLVEAEGATVSPTGTELLREMDEFCFQLRSKHSMESIAESQAVAAVRGMFRRWGVDPSKYRPSSEALMRRLVQGKGLYNISNIVDLSNLGSIETGWPYGLYNRKNIAPPITFRHGRAEEKYEGIGRRIWHLAGRPVLADAHGPFGSPISDSTRTQIAEGVSEVLTVLFAPAGATDTAIEAAMETQARRLTEHAGAGKVENSLIG